MVITHISEGLHVSCTRRHHCPTCYISLSTEYY